MAEDTQQLNDLTQLYASFSETELRNLAGTLGDLTEVAQQALADTRALYRGQGLTLRRDLASIQEREPSYLQGLRFISIQAA